MDELRGDGCIKEGWMNSGGMDALRRDEFRTEGGMDEFRRDGCIKEGRIQDRGRDG